MESFQESIEQMLWPDRREKDQLLFANMKGPGVGVIDRITVDSYLEVPEGYIPPYLRPLIGVGRRLFPFLVGGSGYSVKIGPFPKDFPIGLVTNMDMLGSELPQAQQEAHRKRVLELLKATKRELKRTRDLGATLRALVPEMLAVSKCKDFVVNKGHYFGTDHFTEEPGLSDSDKRALIGFIKTF
jgi:hypothetical protein